MLMVAMVFAMTPAGTEIRNQASAKYVDSAGQPRTTTSNEVVTVVQPVYGFEIKPDGEKTAPGQTQSAVPGGKVYFPYTVTNSGNTTDTIKLSLEQDTSDNFDLDTPKVYLDENCDGQINPGESELAKSGNEWQLELAMEESACLIVEGTIPAGQQQNDSALVNLKGTSDGDPNLDPDGNGNPGDDNNWAKAVATENAALTATKSASPSDAVKRGQEITYTIEGSNVGGSAAYAATVNSVGSGILVKDKIPAHTSVSSMPTGQAGAGTVKYVYSTDGGQTWSELQSSNLPLAGDASGNNYIGMLIEGTGAFFPQGAQYRFSFTVTVADDVTPADTIENRAAVVFDSNGDGDTDDPGEEVDSNTTINNVAPSYKVYNGPQDDPDSNGDTFTSEFTDPLDSTKTWHYTETPDDSDPRDEDAETITDTVYGGDTVYFPFTLQNAGNTDDSFELSIVPNGTDANDSKIPPDWTCQIVAADGTTPISGPVGPIAAGETYDYVVKCTIPADYSETNPNVNAAEIKVEAKSTNDPSATNLVTGIVPDVQSGYGVDIDANPGNNNGAQGDGNPPPQTVTPGSTVKIPFDVHNTGHNPDTYDLSTPTFPTDWTGTIYSDPNCDGELDANDNPAPAPVSDTGLMEAGETKCFVLVAEVPDDASPGDNQVKIKATSNADPTKSDEITTTITVDEVYDLTFTPDRSGTVTSPGTIVYDHTVTNNGNTTTTVKFTKSGGKDNWTYQISTDGGNTWTTPENASVDLGPKGSSNDSQTIKVRVIVPDGEPIGTVDTVDFEAVPYDGNTQKNDANPDDNAVTDTTTIVGGDLRLEKEVDLTEAKPGDTLTYTITATNIGTGELKQVIVSDPVPAYTDYVSVSATATGFPAGSQVVYSKDGSSWSTSSSLAAPVNIIYVAVDLNGDNQITDADTMPPGAKITITFKVEVK